MGAVVALPPALKNREGSDQSYCQVSADLHFIQHLTPISQVNFFALNPCPGDGARIFFFCKKRLYSEHF
jgi:hypothetical protein